MSDSLKKLKINVSYLDVLMEHTKKDREVLKISKPILSNSRELESSKINFLGV